MKRCLLTIGYGVFLAGLLAACENRDDSVKTIASAATANTSIQKKFNITVINEKKENVDCKVGIGFSDGTTFGYPYSYDLPPPSDGSWKMPIVLKVPCDENSNPYKVNIEVYPKDPDTYSGDGVWDKEISKAENTVENFSFTLIDKYHAGSIWGVVWYNGVASKANVHAFGNAYKSTHTNDAGFYHLKVIPQGDYQIFVERRHPAYFPSWTVKMSIIDRDIGTTKRMDFSVFGPEQQLFAYKPILPTNYPGAKILYSKKGDIVRDSRVLGIAGGDFDGDGKSNEVAVMKDEIDVINGGTDFNLYVYKVSPDGNITLIGADLWDIPSKNNFLYMAAVDSDHDGKDEIAVLKGDQDNVSSFHDHNLYIYRAPVGNINADGSIRNPGYLLLSFDNWQIPSGNDIVAMAGVDVNRDGLKELAVMKNENGDHNFYIYDLPTRVDRGGEFGSLRAYDLWNIPAGNNTVAMAGGDFDGDGFANDVMLIKRDRMSNGRIDYNAYFYRVPERTDGGGQWGSFLGEDLWTIPGVYYNLNPATYPFFAVAGVNLDNGPTYELIAIKDVDIGYGYNVYVDNGKKWLSGEYSLMYPYKHEGRISE
jgi:hypothetical protein